MPQAKPDIDCSKTRADRRFKEPTVRAALSGLGYDLQWEMGTYIVSDRRAAIDLKTSFELVSCATLDEVVALFRL